MKNARVLDLAVEPTWRTTDKYSSLYPQLAQQTIQILSNTGSVNIYEYPEVTLYKKIVSGLTTYHSQDWIQEEEWIIARKQRNHCYPLLRDSTGWEKLEWIKDHDSRKNVSCEICFVLVQKSEYKYETGPRGPPLPVRKHIN